jgi:hypothetical protein
VVSLPLSSTDPGTSVSSEKAFTPLRFRFSICFEVTTSETVAFSVSTLADIPTDGDFLRHLANGELQVDAEGLADRQE